MRNQIFFIIFFLHKNGNKKRRLDLCYLFLFVDTQRRLKGLFRVKGGYQDNSCS